MLESSRLINRLIKFTQLPDQVAAIWQCQLGIRISEVYVSFLKTWLPSFGPQTPAFDRVP